MGGQGGGQEEKQAFNSSLKDTKKGYYSESVKEAIFQFLIKGYLTGKREK